MSDLHALYRFFGRGDELLYIGITSHIPARLRGHHRDKPWWGEIARMTVEWHLTREAVERAERMAIERESPKYNIQHNGRASRMSASSPDRGDRLESAASADLRLDSLVGSFFLGDSENQVQGAVVAEPFPGWYLVELFEWISGGSSCQKLVTIAEMKGWRFYDDDKWMRNQYQEAVKWLWKSEKGATS